MKDFEGKTAVVTGAASGIGRAMAERFAAEKMNVVLADVQEDALDLVQRVMADAGASVIAVKTDVRRLDQVESLRDAAIDAFGKVHVLCNNAGVGAGALTWETTNADWEWVLGVNLWGVIHGVRAFVPAMIAHGEEGHVVNTASMAGMVAGPFMAPYNVSKFGVVALSETLWHDLRIANSKISVSVLCPGFVNTNIHDSVRNRPLELANESPPAIPEVTDRGNMLRDLLATGMPPADLAEKVFECVRDDRFYILTHPDMKAGIELRFNAIMDEKAPPPTRFV
jgi:NAD(P)-dependent dehydrogenase (short-subunit alcohol dehydrogenase family)